MGSTENPLNPILTAPQNNGLKKKIKTTAIWGQIFSNFNLNTAALKKTEKESSQCESLQTYIRIKV